MLPSYDEFYSASLEERKQLVGRVEARMRQHRYQDHKDDDTDIFHDCVTCGVIENRLTNFRRMLLKEIKEEK